MRISIMLSAFALFSLLKLISFVSGKLLTVHKISKDVAGVVLGGIRVPVYCTSLGGVSRPRLLNGSRCVTLNQAVDSPQTMSSID